MCCQQSIYLTNKRYTHTHTQMQNEELGNDIQLKTRSKQD